MDRDATSRLAGRALERGLCKSDASGIVLDYLDALFYCQGGKAEDIRIHGEFVFIFAGGKLLTVFKLPKELRKMVEKQQKRKRDADASRSVRP